MNDTKKRTRAPKQLTAGEITIQLENLPLDQRVSIFGTLKKSIEDEKQLLQEQLELINANVK